VAKPEAKAEAAPAPKPKTRGRKRGGASVSWQRWRPALILVLVVAVATGGGMFARKIYSEKVENERKEAVLGAAKSAAAAISQEVDQETQALAKLFDESQLAPLLLNDDASARAAREAEFAASHDLVLLARLVQVGTRNPDLESKPPLGYAAMEMLLESEETAKAPPPLALLFGSDDQHILTIWRIDADGALVGHLVLALDVSLLPALMSRVGIADGYAELTQGGDSGKALVLAGGGDKSVRRGPAEVRIEVRETPWRVAFWPGGRLVPAAPLIDVPDWAIPAAGGSLALIIVLTVALRQRKQARLQAALEEAEREKRLEAAAKKAAAKAAAGPVVADGEAVPADGAEGAGLEGQPGGGGIVVEEEAGAMDMPAEIFRAYDIRGIVDEGLSV